MPTADPFVLVELNGRIGNQLFQYAAGYSIARAHDVPLLIDSHDIPSWDYLLPEVLTSPIREVVPAEQLRVGRVTYDIPFQKGVNWGVRRAVRALRSARNENPPIVSYWGDTGRFRPEVFELTLPVCIQGHLQSERYFEDHTDHFAADIHLPSAALPSTSGGELVAVSFRRGDYNALGWALPLPYYERALDEISRRVERPEFVLFGDDPWFVELMIPRVEKYGTVHLGTEHPEPLSQFALMSTCDHAVLANSSFAWWGAWLAEHWRPEREHVVVAPENYARGSDRIPARWHVVEGGTATF